MTPDEQNTFAATMVAHEQVIATLLAFHFQKLSPQQRAQIEAGLDAMPNLGDLFSGYNLDIGTADDLAGLALLYRDAMNRVHKRALTIADHLNGKGTLAH